MAAEELVSHEDIRHEIARALSVAFDKVQFDFIEITDPDDAADPGTWSYRTDSEGASGWWYVDGPEISISLLGASGHVVRKPGGYPTMTVGGLYGSSFEGSTAEEAALAAEKGGYTVVDIVEHGSEIVLVVAE